MQEPSFDTWTTIFLFAAIQGIFVSAVLCFLKKENRYNNSLIALLVFLFSVTLIEYVLYWTHYIYRFPHMMGVSGGFPFLFGVILYLYFRNVFLNKPIIRTDLKHFIPFIIYSVYQLPVYLSSAVVKRSWLTGNNVHASLFEWPFAMGKINMFMPWLMVAQMIWYAILIYRAFNAISKSGHHVRTWFNWLTGLFALFIISFSSYYILIHFSFFSISWDYMISFSMMFFIYFIAWFGYLQPQIFSGFSLRESVQKRYKNSALDSQVSHEILMKLNNIMTEKKLYRESDLRLESLAEIISVSRHHLSQVINEQTGMSFFEYLNQQRIEEAKEILAGTSKKDMNIIEVAYTVGFNNKVSFNTTFKKITGKTPTEFRRDSNSGVMTDADR
jgi:AraC-like DNA-binding protein